MSSLTRVLLAEDSPFICRLLRGYLEDAGGFQVVGMAHTGREAIAKHRELAPDVVALDLTMPDVDGATVLREIRAQRPVPVVVITGATGLDAVQTLRALDAGACEFVMKFDPATRRSPDTVRTEVVEKMRRAARRAAGEDPLVPASALAPPRQTDVLMPALVVIGASTGGPAALRQMLSLLPDSLPGVVVIVQHVPAAFSARLAADLSRFCRLPVNELSEAERLAPGSIRVAPGGCHVTFEPQRRVSFRKYNGEANCPSIDLAMESAAAVYGADAIGVLMTGMGSDGAHGLKQIQSRGGRTLIQDPATCVVAGMTNAALALGVGDFVAAPQPLGERLAAMLGPKGGRRG